MKDDSVYLQHIADCIARIEDYTRDGRETFVRDLKTQDAVLRNLQTLGESARRVSAALIDQHSEIPWKAIAGFRNVLVHDYLGVDVGQIWNVVEKDLPPLRRAIERVIGHA